MLPLKKASRKIVTFMDLGSGPRAERVVKMAQRKHLRERTLEAVDLERSLIRPSAGVTFTTKDATQRLEELIKNGHKGKVINGDSFFAEQVLGKKGLNHLDGLDRCMAAMSTPIDPHLLDVMKKFLVKNGKLYSTTVKWHADPLIKKFKEAGFEVRTRPITEKEASEGPSTTKAFHQMWKEGEFHHFFGKEGWRLFRIVATKRGD